MPAECGLGADPARAIERLPGGRDVDRERFAAAVDAVVVEVIRRKRARVLGHDGHLAGRVEARLLRLEDVRREIAIGASEAVLDSVEHEWLAQKSILPSRVLENRNTENLF